MERDQSSGSGSGGGGPEGQEPQKNGAGIAAAGNQIVTTVLITYAVDSHHPQEAGSVGVFITFVRQIWGFIGPFWFPYIFEDIGLVKTSLVGLALIMGVSFLPTLFLQFFAGKYRHARAE